MRNRLGTATWGIILIFIGLVVGGNTLGIIDVDLFFDGWWTLFIIIPCCVGIVREGPHTDHVVGLIIGILLFLSAQDIVSIGTIIRLIFPILLICGGISILFGTKFSRRGKEPIHINIDRNRDYLTIFSTQHYKCTGESFKGGSIVCIFGKLTLDLREACIEKDICLEVVAVFGSIELLLPANVDIRVSNVPIFGSCTNNVATIVDPNNSTVYIEAVNVFGTTELR